MSRQAHRSALQRIAAENGGYIRWREAWAAGVHRAAFYRLRDEGFIEQEARGLYRIADVELHPYPDYVQVALLAPDAVVCLISALSFHELTTQIPHQMDLAFPKSHWIPRIEAFPIGVYQISEPAFSAGIEVHDLGGTSARVYSVEKTLADCFKFRRTIGTPVAVEALKLYRERRKLKVDALMEHARICRVAKVMAPYLEALI